MRYEFRKFFKACDKGDPAPNRKASLGTAVFKRLLQASSSSIHTAIGQLCNGALHFAMRACEYSITTDKTPRTTLLRLRDIVFLKKGEITTNRKSADKVVITFRLQKNGEKDESIVRRRGKNSQYCPVLIWASIVDRILGYEGASLDSPVNTVMVNGRLGYLTSDMIKTRLRAVVRSLDKDFPISKVTPHSIRATYATVLFQHGASLDVVKLMGRWKSDSFLLYIRKNSLVIDVSSALHDQITSYLN